MATPEATPLINMFSRQQTSPNSDLNQNSINTEDPTATAFTNDATCTDSEGGGCYQLVPYKPSPVLPVFQEEKRSFEFAGKEWSVHQQWNDVGLASVVWEAVSIVSLLLYSLRHIILYLRNPHHKFILCFDIVKDPVQSSIKFDLKVL